MPADNCTHRFVRIGSTILKDTYQCSKCGEVKIVPNNYDPSGNSEFPGMEEPEA